VVRDHFPGDFIVEYIAQTRGWFYTLHVLATALFDRPAFQNVICHGVVLDDDGQKLSKRCATTPTRGGLRDTIGADALRWYLMSSPILRGGDLRIDRTAPASPRWCARCSTRSGTPTTFFTLYANADGHRATFRTDSTTVLDRYVLAKTRELVERGHRALDAYDLAGACAEMQAFLDALNNWYIRRSRERFWALDVAEAIELRVMGSERVLGALAVWNHFVAGEVLAEHLRFGPPEVDMHVERSSLDGGELVIGLSGLGVARP
jgi:isoleucyl-tRNA synthetase